MSVRVQRYMKMFDEESWLEPLLDDWSENQKPNREPRVFILRKIKACLSGTDKILDALYAIFLIWQTALLVPYTIHAVYCCFTFKQVSFQCKQSLVPHSLELELVMIISINIHTIFILWLLSKIPHFLGYKQILKKLSRLPAFWSLIFLVLVGFTGLAIIHLVTTDNFPLLSVLIVSFGIYRISTVALVGVLNYIQGEYIKHKYSYCVFVLFKATLAVFSAENFVFFIVGSLQLAAGVAGLGTDVPDISRVSFERLRHLSSVVFYYKLFDFLWQKIFTDNRNILCHYDYL